MTNSSVFNLPFYHSSKSYIYLLKWTPKCTLILNEQSRGVGWLDGSNSWCKYHLFDLGWVTKWSPCLSLKQWLSFFSPCQSPAELWACLRTSSAPFQCNFSCSSAGNETIQRRELQRTIWEDSSTVLTEVLLSGEDFFLALYPRWDCLNSAPFKHSCTRKIYGLAAVGHLVYFACTMAFRMGHLHKAWQVFELRLLVPRLCTHLW